MRKGLVTLTAFVGIAGPTCTAFAQGSQPRPGAGGGLLEMFILLGLVMLIFYFVLFRDQRRRQKERKEMLANLRKGDKVMTIGGIIGTIVAVRDDEVVVKVDEANNVKVTFVRSAVDKVLSGSGSQEAA